MKILVTGGSGFIGSHLIDKLIQLNHEVISVDNLSANNEKFYFNEKALNLNIDILETDKIIEISKGCDFIFHLAAESRLGSSIKNPKKAIDTNVNGTLSILEASKINNVKGIVFSSTSSIYGLNQNLPLNENEKENCLNAYSSTKYCAELFFKNYYNLYGIKSVILRYFNVFGERAPSTGNYALVTGVFLNQLKNRQPLTVTGDGSQKRDFIHVDDVVSANIKCIENYDNNKLWAAEIFNIGYGESITIKKLAKQLTNYRNIKYIDKKPGEAFDNLSDNKKFKCITDWKPSINICDWVKKF